VSRSQVHVTITPDTSRFNEQLAAALRMIYRSRVLGRYAGLLRAAVDRGELTSTEATGRLIAAQQRLG
jgi:hypothetical protein